MQSFIFIRPLQKLSRRIMFSPVAAIRACTRCPEKCLHSYLNSFRPILFKLAYNVPQTLLVLVLGIRTNPLPDFSPSVIFVTQTNLSHLPPPGHTPPVSLPTRTFPLPSVRCTRVICVTKIKLKNILSCVYLHSYRALFSVFTKITLK